MVELGVRMHHRVFSPGVGEDASCTDSDQTGSVLSRLNAHSQSDLCRKRSVASNPTRGKRKKSSSGSCCCTSDPAFVSSWHKFIYN